MEICLDVNSDMISNLPANVTDQILFRLPIIDAVRTSILSTKWRYKWTTIPELVFHDNQPVQLPFPHNNNSKDKLINFIDRVLLLHSGFIHKFELSTMCLRNCPTLDCWILFLLRKNIKEFVLKFSHGFGEKYKLPGCFYSAQQICTLELHWCVLKPPPTFTGFSNLKSLYLDKTTFVDNRGFECLISKCPLLERLTWICVSGLDNLNLCSPNLKYLCLSGTFRYICFENTPLLSDVSIHTHFDIVKGLSSLPFTCHHLNNLSLDLNFVNVNQICVILCLLNSSPSLRKLEIEAYSFQKLGRNTHKTHTIENIWKEQTLIDLNMSGLQIVKFTNIQGFKLELEFIKLLLANSPMLEMLIIRAGELDSDHKGLEFLKELLIFPRASPKAKIKFLEHHEK